MLHIQTLQQYTMKLPDPGIQITAVVSAIDAGHLGGALGVVEQHGASFGRLQQSQLGYALTFHCNIYPHVTRVSMTTNI
jgi:hypothetical protein